MEISAQELKKRQDEGKNDFVLVDVREPDERAEYHIGGKHIPLGQISTSLDELEGHKGDEVIVYCRSGRRSAMAQELLRQAGFSNVRNLEGGVLAYQELQDQQRKS